MQIEVRWEKKQKQKWLCNSRSMKLFESASHREPPRWEVSLFWEHKLEFQRYEDTGLSLKVVDCDIL